MLYARTIALVRDGANLGDGTHAIRTSSHTSDPPTRPGVRSARHRYTCREADAEGGCYLYEGPFRAFRAELPGDADGLVLDYPEIFRRIA